MSELPDDRVRGFPAFGAAKRGRGQFARTWWGKAWINALEDTALDQGPLKQGRRYAYAGRVGTITVSPGRLTAGVAGASGRCFNTVVSISQLTDAEWARFLDRVAEQAGHVAALLDRDMPRELVDAAEDTCVQLLPGGGDLEPDCDCPGWELPCQHAAALCYQFAWLLDADPFVLLLMRGRSERELLGELHVRDTPATGPATGRLDAAAVAALVAVAADRARQLLETPWEPHLNLRRTPSAPPG